ncbi:MAG: uridine kinase [Ktedonobacterales bacterium]|nr:uridine kinase [Ktedonobacterales bacterium]
MLDQLADRIVALPRAHPPRVAVDGIDAAGKTTLADELVSPLMARGRSVIRASIDGFHRPRVERYRRGATSPEGYYLDAFDSSALREALLLPLGPTGSRRYRRAVFDFRADRPLLAPDEVAAADAVLVMDGVFLLRPELRDLWEYRIVVDVPFEVAVERAVCRDVALFGSAEVVEARYRERYLPGQRLYFAAVHPRERADVLIENADPANPLPLFRKAE